MLRRLVFITLAAAVTLAFAASPAGADKISNAFRGKILFSVDPLPPPDAENAKATIKSYKSLALKTLGSSEADGVATWQFYFTAFMKKKPKTSSLTLEFYTADKEKLFVADKRLNGADPNMQILSSPVTISEDENLNRNRKYNVKLVAKVKGKDVTLATGAIATK